MGNWKSKRPSGLYSQRANERGLSAPPRKDVSIATSSLGNCLPAFLIPAIFVCSLFISFGNVQGYNHLSKELGRLIVPIAGTIENV